MDDLSVVSVLYKCFYSEWGYDDDDDYSADLEQRDKAQRHKFIMDEFKKRRVVSQILCHI